MLPTHIQVRVVRKRCEADDIRSFELASTSGEALPNFSAGSHIDVRLPGGLVRQYSLCNAPMETHRYQIAVLREPSSRGGSVAMHDLVHEGDVLTISPPRNHFPLERSPAGTVLLAAGIGITPILCMAERLAVIGEPFEMHYCTRSRNRTAFLSRIKESSFARQAHFHMSDEAGSRLNLDQMFERHHEGRHVYVCGPRRFIDAAVAAAQRGGWPDAQVHREYFAGQAVSTEADGSFDVRLASSGRTISIAKEVSVVKALADAGIEIPTSCEQGVCGTCITRVLEGVPDHRDSYLMPEEQARNDQFTPCCSRSKSPVIVLDL